MRTCALPGCEVEVTGRRQTCSASHRQALSRLRKRVYNDHPIPVETHDAARDFVAEADPVELALEVFKQELTPHVRAAITEDVVKGIRALVTLQPELIASLAKDLTNHDPIARGRAQTLIAKYTLGQLDQKEEAANRPLTINFGDMPTPQNGDTAAPVTADADELRECEECGTEKTLDHFEPGAGRCNECQADIKREIVERYG